MKYPRIGGIRRGPTGGMCLVCGLKGADSLMEIQVTHMRGDDDVYKLHKDCYKYVVKKEGQNLADYLAIRREEIKR